MAAAGLFSTAGAVIKACGLTTWQIASFRSTVAAITMLALVPAARRGWSARALLVGVTYGATMLMFVAANKLTTAANAVFLQATAPLYLILLAPLLLGERIRRRDLLVTGVIAAGLAVIVADASDPTAIAPNPMAGNLAGALSGLSWALTVVGLRWLGRQRSVLGREGPSDAGEDREAAGVMPAIVAGNLVAAAFALPLALPVTGATTLDWTLVGYLGVFQISLAYVLLARAVPHVPAFEASLLLLTEVALNPVWVWLVHGEEPGRWSMAGGALVVAATLAKARLDARPSGRVAGILTG